MPRHAEPPARTPTRQKLAKNISLDAALWEDIVATAAAQGRSMAGFIAYTMRVACGPGAASAGAPGADEAAPADFQYKPRAVALAPFDGGVAARRGRPRRARTAGAAPTDDVGLQPTKPQLTKPQREWKEQLDARVRLVQLDESLGKYTEWWIVAGRAAVDITTTDMGDYIAAGAVVEEPLDRWYSESESAEWLRERQRAGMDFAWVFVTGDCESRIEQYGVETAARLRATPGIPVETLEALQFQENKEAAERAAYGAPAGIIELAAQRMALLRAQAALTGSAVQMPPQLLRIVSRARGGGWRSAAGVLPLMLPGVGAGR